MVDYKSSHEWIKVFFPVMNVVLDDPLVKKHLKHFRWSVADDGRLLITYDFMDYETLCTVIGCLYMGDDPIFSLSVRLVDVECARVIYSLPVVERELLVELFEYLEYECPRKVVKKVLVEDVGG